MVLVVNDGLATNSQSFTMLVQTVAEASQQLITVINSQVARPQPLDATISAAIAAMNGSNPKPAINLLKAFENKVAAQIVPMDPSLAAELNQAAERIISLVGMDCATNPPAARISKFNRGTNGRLHLHFEGSPGHIFIVEGSTNLLEWEAVGVARETRVGEFDFEDGKASSLPARFYRLAVPGIPSMSAGH
jgi:hypothetical protein